LLRDTVSLLVRPTYTPGEVLNLLGIWRGASFARMIHQTGFDEPGKGAPHEDETTCFATHP
jgi:hypothetical protein